METVASFDIDAQYAFTPECPNELPVPGGTEIVEELNRQAQYARIRLGSKDAHSPSAEWVASDEFPQFSPVSGNNMDIRWNLHAVPGTKGFQLIDGLPKPDEYDYFVWKGIEPNMHPYGACYHDLGHRISTGAIEFLKLQLIETVILGGLATDYCVKTTALQLLDAGFKVVINLAACRGIAEDTVNAALAELKEKGAVIVENAAQLESVL